MKKFILIIISLLLIAGSYYFFFMNKALAPGKSSPTTNGQNIPVVIVPHFNDFAAKRAELLKQVGAIYKPETAIVVSVNHFNTGGSNIITAERTWTLNGGNVSSDATLVKKLAASGVASSDENAFANEHGITNVLPDVRDNIAGNILPIIIKDTTPRDQVDKLEDWIDSNCKDCMVIASVDFSHYQPSAIAKVHDQFSIQALRNMDADQTLAAETDSPQTLYLAEKVAAKNKATNFNLFYNSNSGEVGKNDDAETTSVVLGYYSDKVAIPTASGIPSTSFVIAGDAMFDRNVWQRYNPDLKKVFDNFGTRVFRGSDISLINLEGPVSSASHEGIKTGGMSFNFQPQVPSVLKYLNIGEVSLANNHTNNAGASGFAATKSMLEKSGIKYFGLPSGYSEASVLRIPGEVPVSIIGIMALDSFDEAALEAKIKSEKAAGQTVIIFPHWGTEYAPKHSTSQEQMAKDWISAGADMIVGSHPHVTEDFEIVDGKPVVYSLGNFVFDQFFSQETQEGLVVAGTITKDKITLSFLPTVEKAVKPEFMTGADKTAKIKTIIDLSLATGFKKLTSDTIEIAR
ncbi:MAG: AmmeMemoRadiSam system protein B [Candidatus Berkelbacteria bacterium]